MPTICLAQNKRLIVNSDYAVFYSADNGIQSYVEVYFSYPDNSYTLVYNKQDSTYHGNLQFEIVIKSQTGDTVLKDKWETPFHQKSIREYMPQDFYGLKRYYVPQGEHSLKLLVSDVNGKRQTENKHNLQVEPLGNKLNLSSLQIANRLVFAGNTSTTDKSPELFLKNQHYVYPNPQREVSADIPTLYLYSEIYNAKKTTADSITLSYKIWNAKNEPVFEHKKHKPAIADAIVETIALPLDAVATGVYTIQMTAWSNEADSINSSNTFYLINPNIDATEKTYYTEDELFDLSEFATYTIEKVDLTFAQCKVLATKAEVNTWDKLTDLKAKQRFLFRFWYTRNSDVNNSFNKELAEFRDRLQYVNTYYSYAGSHDNGWQTDRGEIYITFGEPDYKEEVPGNPIEKPYQIWTYHAMEGGAQFVFVDNMGLNNFRLVHSTHSAYIHNYNWQRLTNSNSGNEE